MAPVNGRFYWFVKNLLVVPFSDSAGTDAQNMKKGNKVEKLKTQGESIKANTSV